MVLEFFSARTPANPIESVEYGNAAKYAYTMTYSFYPLVQTQIILLMLNNIKNVKLIKIMSFDQIC